MKFVSLPRNGSSWQEPLLYTLDTESSTPQNLTVEILDMENKRVIATKRLYGVTTAEIDVAPYLRSLCDLQIKPSSQCTIKRSYSSCRVALSVGAVMSEARLFAMNKIDHTCFALLSNVADESKIEYGETVIVSLYTPSSIKAVLSAHTEGGSRQYQLSWNVAEHSVDVIIPTSFLAQNVLYITIDIYCSMTLVKTLKYNVVSPDERSHRLYWRNERGGVESYDFPHSLRLASGAVVDKFELQSGTRHELRSATTEYRLSSAIEPQAELERISGVIRSPYVYEIVDNVAYGVNLVNRTIEYGDHGRLSQVVVGIRREWGGGDYV